jgi:hypothetical protein
MIEDFGWGKRNGVLFKQLLEVCNPAFEVKDIAARDLSLCDRIVAYALDIRLLATRTAREALVAAVLPQPAAVARTHIAEVAHAAGLSGSLC